ncbi:MAG TPA: hypothetical protein DIW27_10230 [Cytophagales bacterium]|nr:hypothetical protein [Cytophagales bacterium]
MESKTIQEKRNELKKLYFESARINSLKKKLEDDLLHIEVTTGKRESVARRRKGEKDPSLPIATIGRLSGFSRDKVYRLLLSGILPDRHPISVGHMIRTGHGFRDIPLRYREEYQAWKAIEAEKRSRKRHRIVTSEQVRTAK